MIHATHTHSGPSSDLSARKAKEYLALAADADCFRFDAREQTHSRGHALALVGILRAGKGFVYGRKFYAETDDVVTRLDFAGGSSKERLRAETEQQHDDTACQFIVHICMCMGHEITPYWVQ